MEAYFSSCFARMFKGFSQADSRLRGPKELTKPTNQADQQSSLPYQKGGGDNKPTGPLHHFFSKTSQSWQFTHFRKKNVPIFLKKTEHRQLALNLCLIYIKLLVHVQFEVNRTKIKGGCQLGRKVVTHNSNRDLPLLSWLQNMSNRLIY